MERVLKNPDLIVAGIATLDSQEGGGLEEEIAQAERDLRSIQMEEDRAVRLFVSGKITEAQLDLQRKFITERLESARAKLDDYSAQEASGTEKRRLMEEVLAWAREFGQGLDELTHEERHDYLQMLVEQVIIDRDNNVDITLAIPIDDDSSDPDSPDPESPQPECVSIGSQESSLSDSFWPCSRILIPHCLGRRLATSGAGRALTSRLDLFLGVCRTALEGDEKKAPPRSSPETRAPQGKRHLTADSLAAGLLQFPPEALSSAGSYLEGHRGPPTIPC